MPFEDEIAAGTVPVAIGSEVEGPSVFAGSAANLLGLVAANAMGFVMGLITAKTLGEVSVGILAVVFGIVEFGRALSNFTHNPSILEYHRGKTAAAVFGTSLALKVVGSALFVALIVVAAPFLAETFQIPVTALILASTLLFIGAFFEVGSARLEADNKMFLRTMLASVGPIAALVIVIALVLSGAYSVHTSVIATLSGTAAMSIAFVLAWRGPWRLKFDAKIGRYLLGYGAPLVFSTLLSQALIWTDTLMVSAILGNGPAGIYNVVFQLTFVMVTASVAIGVALLPAMSRLAGRGEDTSLAYQRGTLLSFGLASVLAIAYVLLGHPFLGVYGAAFTVGYPSLLVLTIFGLAAALAVPASSALTVHGHANLLMALSLVQAVVNVPLNYVLIQALGILGAAIATTTVFAFGLVAMWILVKRKTGHWPISRAVLAEVPAAVRRFRRRA